MLGVGIASEVVVVVEGAAEGAAESAAEGAAEDAAGGAAGGAAEGAAESAAEAGVGFVTKVVAGALVVVGVLTIFEATVG